MTDALDRVMDILFRTEEQRLTKQKIELTAKVAKKKRVEALQKEITALKKELEV